MLQIRRTDLQICRHSSTLPNHHLPSDPHIASLRLSSCVSCWLRKPTNEFVLDRPYAKLPHTRINAALRSLDTTDQCNPSVASRVVLPPSSTTSPSPVCDRNCRCHCKATPPPLSTNAALQRDLSPWFTISYFSLCLRFSLFFLIF